MSYLACLSLSSLDAMSILYLQHIFITQSDSNIEEEYTDEAAAKG